MKTSVTFARVNQYFDQLNNNLLRIKVLIFFQSKWSNLTKMPNQNLCIQ